MYNVKTRVTFQKPFYAVMEAYTQDICHFIPENLVVTEEVTSVRVTNV